MAGTPWQKVKNNPMQSRESSDTAIFKASLVDRPRLNESVDMLLQLFDQGERCAVQRLALEDGKSSLDPIEP
jgi:hypothetical protein